MIFRLADWSTDTWLDGQVFENHVPIAYFFANRVASPAGYDSFDAKGNYLFIADFVVASRYRGRGIGRMMYEELEKEAKRRGIRTIWLQPQPRSEAFWEKMGFTYRPPKTERPTEMEKQLFSGG